MMRRVLVTGASGFIGRALCSRLQGAGFHVMRLARSTVPAPRDQRLAGVDTVVWDPRRGLTAEQADALGRLDAVVHLAGEPIAARRWSAPQKRRIRDSRVEDTRMLVRSLSHLDPVPRTLVSASAVGYYGNRGDEALDETSAPGSDFLADVCRRWEAEARRGEAAGMRTVQLRLGMVLGPKGGALQRMLLPFRLGLGGPLGSGMQWMSWIHLEDVVRLIMFALDDQSKLRGPVNATGPEPVRNREFTRALAKALRRPAVIPVPSLLLRLALGEMSQVILDSQRVLPRAAQAAGFSFSYPRVDEALRASLDGNFVSG